MVSEAQGTRNKEERTRGKAMDGCVQDDGRMVDLDKVDDRIEWRKVSRRPNPPSGDKREDDDDDDDDDDDEMDSKVSSL